MLQVRYRTLEQLDDVMRRLKQGRRLKMMPTAPADRASGGLKAKPSIYKRAVKSIYSSNVR